MTSSRPAEPDQALIDAVRAGLGAAADPVKAPGMQAYMKSAMPYLGVPVPAVRQIVREQVQFHPVADVATLTATTLSLWRAAEFREQRYAATALLAVPIGRGRLELLPVCREMITTGAWWDHVDEVSHRVGELLAAHPTEMTTELRSWATNEDLWLRRASIIAQLDRKQSTDRDLLSANILANVADPNFFIRKAIGWALRQYARVDADWVRDFVSTHHAAMSTLSRREALKHLP